jgi:hypothetical protein
VEAFVEPFVTLGVEGRARREEVVPRVVALAQAEPGVHAAFDVRTAEALRASSDPLRQSVGLGIDGVPPGDVYIVPRAGWVIDPDMAVGQGTSHGGPWPADREVPVIVWGERVAPRIEARPVDARRIAPTIAALLGVPPPRSARQQALAIRDR